MSIRTVTRAYLSCDREHCHATYYAEERDANDPSAQRMHASLGHGWLTNAPGGRDYCPEHLADGLIAGSDLPNLEG